MVMPDTWVHPMKDKKHSPDSIIKMRNSLKGRTPWNKGKTGLQVGYWLGKTRIMSSETRRKQSDTMKRLGHKPPIMTGKKHWNWKGGVTPDNLLIRHSGEYKIWRTEIFKRDRWTCVECGYRSKSSKDIQADHIKPFSLYPELRFDLDNGRTLCVPCHRAIGWSLFRENNPRKKVLV